MRYEVPQFSEVQTKVIGPFTLKQFFYLAGGGLIFYLLFKLTNLFLTFTIGLAAALLGVAFAFVKINGETLETLLLKFINFAFKPKFYTWQKELPKDKKVRYENDEEEE